MSILWSSLIETSLVMSVVTFYSESVSQGQFAVGQVDQAHCFVGHTLLLARLTLQYSVLHISPAQILEIYSFFSFFPCSSA
ncbi:hypothetical protein BKA64DRAFT_677558 [Cadophora sp. MPI-SDFR-AT-0126]|nr:hypothetical protein BKA64DRAFT_677558 [Leotiomycetes sp. MPI-SDFR-AT-0126]